MAGGCAAPGGRWAPVLGAAEPVGLCLPAGANTLSSAGEMCCWGSAPRFGGLWTLQSGHSLAGERADGLVLGGSSPPQSRVGLAPCYWVRVAQGHGATEGTPRVGMGSPRCSHPGGSAPTGRAPGLSRAVGAGGGAAPRSPTATRDHRAAPGRRAGPGRLRAGPGLSRGWALRVPAATRRDGPPAPAGGRSPLPGYRSRFTPYNGAGTSPGLGASERGPGPEGTGVPGPSSPPRRSKPGPSRAPGAAAPLLPGVSSPKHPLCCFAKALKYSWRCAERLLMNF